MLRPLASVTFAIIALVGCTATPSLSPGSGFFFPRHDSPLGVGDAALLAGVVRMPGSCIVVVMEDDTTWLPIWPADVTVGRLNDQPTVVGPDQTLLLEVGDAFPDDVYRLGGSEVRPDDQELIGPVPDTCTFDRMWAVSGVLNPAGGPGPGG